MRYDMSNIITVDFKPREDVTSDQPLAIEDYSTRMARIRQSLDKINTLMAEPKKPEVTK